MASETFKWTNKGTLSLHGLQLRTVSGMLDMIAAPELTETLVLNLKEVSFAAEVVTVIEHGKKQPLSIIRFTQERGAASSFHRVVDTMNMIFDARALVVADRNKRKMMIKTLNS